MSELSFKWRIIVLFAIFIVITNSIFVFARINLEKNAYIAEQIELAYSLGKIMQKPALTLFQTNDSRPLDEIVTGRIGKIASLYVTVYDINWWRIWGDSPRVPHEGFPKIDKLRSEELRATSGDTLYEIVMPVKDGEKVLGALSVGVPNYENKAINKKVAEFSLLYVSSVVISLMVIYVASLSFINPVEKLLAAFEAFSAGEYSVRVDIKEDGYFGELAASFNNMANKLQRAFQREERAIESEKWATVGKLAASIAHEIRNPLVSIRGLVEIIGESVSGDLKNHSRIVIQEVDRLNGVVSGLLSLARPERASLRDCDMKILVSELVSLMQHQAKSKKIEFSVELPEESCIAMADAEKIKQAFMNLLLNAFQAAGSNGRVDVLLTCSQESCEFKVSNSGKPIPPAVQERMFTAFYTTKANGTGLGLAITKQIIDLHNGRIDFVSNDDFTTFIVILNMKNENTKI